MDTALHLISSMATQSLLRDLAAAWRGTTALHIESVGGVDAAKRVRMSEAFDGVVLASDAIDKLVADGHVLAGSRIDLVRSGVAVAVRAGASRPAIDSADAVKAAVLAAPSISLSTGPSGVALTRLFERWGIGVQVAAKMVQAPPGVPVGRLVAEGQVALGFQQLSELLNLPGIAVLGPLPDEIQITTVFSGGVAATCGRPDAVRAVLAWMASPVNADLKQRHGMEAA